MQSGLMTSCLGDGFFGFFLREGTARSLSHSLLKCNTHPTTPGFAYWDIIRLVLLRLVYLMLGNSTTLPPKVFLYFWGGCAFVQGLLVARSIGRSTECPQGPPHVLVCFWGETSVLKVIVIVDMFIQFRDRFIGPGLTSINVRSRALVEHLKDVLKKIT